MGSARVRLGCVATVLAAGLVFAPAGSGVAMGARSARAATAGVVVPRLVWHRCTGKGQTGFQCATARVPLDYRYPRGAMIKLAVIRHRASDGARRLGSVFYNPGGPGMSGVELLPHVLGFFPAALVARFDVISWDPRGVGASTAVQCFASEGAGDGAVVEHRPKVVRAESGARRRVSEHVFAAALRPGRGQDAGRVP